MQNGVGRTGEVLDFLPHLLEPYRAAEREEGEGEKCPWRVCAVLCRWRGLGWGLAHRTGSRLLGCPVAEGACGEGGLGSVYVACESDTGGY